MSPEKSTQGDTARSPSGLLLGPIVRRGDAGGIALWVEVDRPVEVVVRLIAPAEHDAPDRVCRADTFVIGEHHYAIVEVDSLGSSGCYEYTVELDDVVVWPDPTMECPPSRLEPWRSGEPVRISGGSCRQQAPQETNRRRRWFSDQAPDTPTEATAELGVDALAALAQQIQDGVRDFPHLLLLSGDQVYADETHQDVIDHLEARRGGPPPSDRPQVTSFDEYTWLYQRTWSHPLIRWLMSCVECVMIFDDHDVIDDWNISDTWARDIAEEPWWQDRLDSSLMAYWTYQHLGNISAHDRAEDELYRAITAAPDTDPTDAGSPCAAAPDTDPTDAGSPCADRGSRNLELLRDFARSAGSGEQRGEYSFSYAVDVGPIQVLVVDARNGRVLDPDRRSMLSDQDWDLVERALADNPDTLIVSSVPWLLPPGIHQLERLVSRVVHGDFGSRLQGLGEKVRRAIDLEHWAAFGRSVEMLTALLRTAAKAPGRTYPLVVFSGDVHFAYLAHKSLDRDNRAYQLVSSPMRQGDAAYEQVARWAAMTAAFDSLLRRIGGGRHHKAPAAGHRIVSGVWTDNNIASLTYRADGLHVQLDMATLNDGGLELHPLLSRLLP